MSEPVGAIVAKQIGFAALALAALLAIIVGAGWALAKRSGPAPARVPASAVDACDSAIRSQMSNPGTVKFLAGGISTRVRDDGGYLVRRTFRASNAFGMESEIRGLCSFPAGGGDPFVTFTERG